MSNTRISFALTSIQSNSNDQKSSLITKNSKIPTRQIYFVNMHDLFTYAFSMSKYQKYEMNVV